MVCVTEVVSREYALIICQNESVSKAKFKALDFSLVFTVHSPPESLRSKDLCYFAGNIHAKGINSEQILLFLKRINKRPAPSTHYLLTREGSPFLRN